MLKCCRFRNMLQFEYFSCFTCKHLVRYMRERSLQHLLYGPYMLPLRCLNYFRTAQSDLCGDSRRRGVKRWHFWKSGKALKIATPKLICLYQVLWGRWSLRARRLHRLHAVCWGLENAYGGLVRQCPTRECRFNRICQKKEKKKKEKKRLVPA